MEIHHCLFPQKCFMFSVKPFFPSQIGVFFPGAFHFGGGRGVLDVKLSHQLSFFPIGQLQSYVCVEIVLAVNQTVEWWDHYGQSSSFFEREGKKKNSCRLLKSITRKKNPYVQQKYGCWLFKSRIFFKNVSIYYS